MTRRANGVRVLIMLLLPGVLVTRQHAQRQDVTDGENPLFVR